jgi:hypothetical protein
MKCKDPFKNCDDFACIKNGCQSDARSIEIGHLHDDDFLVVHEVVENPDGTATVQLDIGKNALRTLVEVGFIAILKKGIRDAELEDSKRAADLTPQA